MIVGVLLSHILDAIGIIYLISVTWKVARGYPLSRWFF